MKHRKDDDRAWLYFDVPVDIVIGHGRRGPVARFWRFRDPEHAQVIVYDGYPRPGWRAVLELVPVRRLRISGRAYDPPALPGWCTDED